MNPYFIQNNSMWVDCFFCGKTLRIYIHPRYSFNKKCLQKSLVWQQKKIELRNSMNSKHHTQVTVLKGFVKYLNSAEGNVDI